MYQVCKKRPSYLRSNNVNAYRSFSSAGLILNRNQDTTEHVSILLSGQQTALEFHAFQYYDRFPGFNPRGFRSSLFPPKGMKDCHITFVCLLPHPPQVTTEYIAQFSWDTLVFRLWRWKQHFLQNGVITGGVGNTRFSSKIGLFMVYLTILQLAQLWTCMNTISG